MRDALFLLSSLLVTIVTLSLAVHIIICDLRLQMHKVVWGCKHPRLEAVYPQSFQSDVCCCRLPQAPQKWKS